MERISIDDRITVLARGLFAALFSLLRRV